MLNVTVSGCTMSNDIWPEWERVLSSAAHLHQLQIQLATPLPYDIDDEDLSEYNNLA